VRRTGGLEDSIVDATPDAVKAGTATGFVFDGYTADEMLAAIRRALDLFAKKTTWKKIQKTAMAQDFSWTASAKIYEALFRKMTKAN
jgi:starch synthase